MTIRSIAITIMAATGLAVGLYVVEDALSKKTPINKKTGHVAVAKCECDAEIAKRDSRIEKLTLYADRIIRACDPEVIGERLDNMTYVDNDVYETLKDEITKRMICEKNEIRRDKATDRFISYCSECYSEWCDGSSLSNEDCELVVGIYRWKR